jgi:hypothetical protein
VLVGEIAHIVAQSPSGPRRNAEVPGGNVDGYGNLILLCHEHHELVDQQHHTYPIERLLQFKTDHEQWVRTRLSRNQEFEDLLQPDKTVTETVFSWPGLAQGQTNTCSVHHPRRATACVQQSEGSQVTVCFNR